ncbi:cytochrome P450 [Nocardia sp. CDC159]|uniref:Cytochrome P450 n=1 Tax=Nocardia pulmonis TaxID=2951408 RepID=A0A9X2EDE5_9NOCA|nr:MULTISPECIES: cytochrome P450 [Nocardia]MCM6778296.1 cytochrome P450 [Nocardia pulmonis]MCM6791185.1 cytochrome P450 [Nocardia sp. CDC159]
MLTTVDPETSAFLVADNVRDQVLTFLVAGHETTASMLATALHYVASVPGLQDELRAEVDVCGGFDYDALIRMRRRLFEECADRINNHRKSHPDLGTLMTREIEVLRLGGTGISNTEVATRLTVSESTVKTHLHRVMTKFDICSRAQAVGPNGPLENTWPAPSRYSALSVRNEAATTGSSASIARSASIPLCMIIRKAPMSSPPVGYAS